MSDLVTACHPVVVDFVPRRGRVPRLGLRRTLTPVEFARVDADVPRLVHVFSELELHKGMEVHEIHGRAWLRLPGAARDGSLRAYVEGAGAGQRRNSVLDDAFAGSPLSWLPGIVTEEGRLDDDWKLDQRGGDLREAEGGRILRDRTDEYRSALSAMVANEIRLAGDDAFVSTGGPLVTGLPAGRVTMLRRAETTPVSFVPSDREGQDICRANGRREVMWHPRAATDFVGHPLAPFSEEGVDMLHFANTAPRDVLRLLSETVRKGRAGPTGEDPKAGPLLAQLIAFARRGSLGMVEAAEALEVAELVTDAASIPALRRSAGHIGSSFLDEILRFAVKRVIARKDAPVSEVDAEALTGLGPA